MVLYGDFMQNEWFFFHIIIYSLIKQQQTILDQVDIMLIYGTTSSALILAFKRARD